MDHAIRDMPQDSRDLCCELLHGMFRRCADAEQLRVRFDGQADALRDHREEVDRLRTRLDEQRSEIDRLRDLIESKDDDISTLIQCLRVCCTICCTEKCLVCLCALLCAHFAVCGDRAAH